MAETVEVWVRGDEVYVNAMGETTQGFHVSVPPFLRLDVSRESAEILGAAIRDARVGCATVVEHPTDWDTVLAPLYDVARVSGEREFNKKAVRVSIVFGESIRISKWIRQGRGFGPSGDAPIELELTSGDAAVGAAVTAVLS